MPPFKDDNTENGTAHDEPSRWEQDGGPEPSTSASSMQVTSRSGSPDAEDPHTPLPVWLRESSKSFHWRWVPYRIRQYARAVVHWTKGPDPPQIQKIRPFFPSIQEAPVKLVNRLCPKRIHKAGLLALFLFSWLLTFSLVLHHSASAGSIKGYGKPQSVWCGASYW